MKKFAALALIALGFAAMAMPLAAQPYDCSVLGPGYAQHPEFPQACCHPNFLPVPGMMLCTRDGKPPPPPEGGAPPPVAVQPGAPQPAPAEGLPQCVPSGQACVLGGVPCCQGGCGGDFPNTTCRVDVAPLPPAASGPKPGLPQCVPFGNACVQGGTPCCEGACRGEFPNLFCQ